MPSSRTRRHGRVKHGHDRLAKKFANVFSASSAGGDIPAIKFWKGEALCVIIKGETLAFCDSGSHFA
jgi:hypothetical protein